MTAHCSLSRPAAPLYFVECSYGKLGVEFQATDRDENSRAGIIRQIRTGDIDPRKIIEVTEPCDDFPYGRAVDVTAELCREAEQHEPLTLDELHERLRGMLLDHDRDIRKHEIA